MQSFITFSVEVGGLKTKPFFSKDQALNVAKDVNGFVKKIIPEQTNSAPYLEDNNSYLVIVINEEKQRHTAYDNNGGFTVSSDFIDTCLVNFS